MNSVCDLIYTQNGSHNKGNLLLGGVDATQLHILNYFDIKAVITIARNCDVNFPKNEGIKHLKIDAEDDENYQICKHFAKTNAFIEENLENTNVLVHCMAGISRSATIVCAYLIKLQKRPAGIIIEEVKKKRTKVDPNQGFVNQLEYYSLENFI